MRGLDPRIHHLRKSLPKRMDCRVKPGNDGYGFHAIRNTGFPDVGFTSPPASTNPLRR
jgi:hypothetical protein